MRKITIEEAVKLEWTEDEYLEYEERYLEFVRGLE